MKRIVCLLLSLILVLAIFASCDIKSENSAESEKTSSTETELKTEVTKESDSVTNGETESETKGDVESETKGDVETESTPDVETESTSGNSTETSTETTRYTYIDFTSSEKALFNSVVGSVIPFLSNNEYFVEEYTYDNEIGVNFYTFGNTQSEFDAYRALFSDYTYDGTEDDEYGDAWYFYSKGNVYVDMAFYYYEDDYVVDVYVYVIDENGGGTETDPNQGGEDGEHSYTDFTSEEKALFNSVVGTVIPFIPNDYYFVEEYSYETEVGVNFYTFGNTQAEFDAYRALFSDYTYDGTEDDEYGDAWYFYSKGDVYVDMTFYYYENEYVADVYVYIDSGNAGGDDTETDNGNDNTEIDYGSIESPVSTTYAYNACADLANGVSSAYPFYVQGTVTKIGETGSYYKNVYFTDGKTEMLIYTINMGSGITGFEVGDTITAYGYIKNYSGTIEMATYNGTVYVYVVAVEGEAGGNQGGNTEPDDRTYTDFTSEEKSLFSSIVGTVIPFLPNNEYVVEEYTYDNEIGVNFYTFGNTQAEFDAYRALFSGYTYDGTEDDEDGDAWYFYSKGDVYVDMTFYYYENEYVADIYVYILIDDGSGDIGGGEIVLPDDSLITNNGQGLPEDDGDGVYDVDFTKGNYVQNVTDQGYYIDGCPTVGSPAVLVIPVEFSDVTAASKGYTIDNLEKIFNGSGDDTCYYSVHDYFYISSYNQLDLDITVVDSWFRPEKNSQYYADATYDYYGDDVEIGDQLILDEALAYLSTIMDLSEFDSDKNGVIDAVVMVYTLDIDENVDFQWAYRYWNIYADDDGYYYEYDEVSANDYVWISYEFMFEGYDEDENLNYDTSNPLNPYTFIHEFSHVLGADDYYDTSYNEEPMGGLDIMDSMVGDHNAFTKFNYGWLTTTRLIVTESTVTVTLDAFVNNGDTIILATNWDETLGAYQEYYIISYYTGVGLNAGEGGYFMRDGIVVYHVNASLYAEESDGETYYDIYNNNISASDQYGTQDNLIEYVKSESGNYTYVVGDSLPAVADDLGTSLGYTFVVDELTENTATLTFTKK